ncbi:MAG: hypothetical protein ACK4RZ_06750 [Paracoccaceae bacterium]
MWLACSTPTLLAGCTQDLSAVHPAGPAALAIATLWWVLLVGAVAIFVLVMVLLVLPSALRVGCAGHRAQP